MQMTVLALNLAGTEASENVVIISCWLEIYFTLVSIQNRY